MNAQLIFVHALSPLHAGTGQGIGVIDLPIAREKATGLPFLPGSSLKGPLKESVDDPELRRRVFGPDTGNADEHASSVQISDQRLLLLPVRSLAGTFAWVTSPYVLLRFARDLESLGAADLPPVDLAVGAVDTGLVAPESALTMLRGGQSAVFLEDLDLNVQPVSAVRDLGLWFGQRVFPNSERWQNTLASRLCVVHDDVLNFLLTTALEITARVRLEQETKTVASGGLWYEESLPAETILSGLVVTSLVKASAEDLAAVLNGLDTRPIQLGGKATIGRGLCQLRLV